MHVSTFRLSYQVGHLEARSRLIQPPSVTVDPLPFAFLAQPVTDASAISGRLTIKGGDLYETSGDTVIFDNEDGASNTGQLIQRDEVRMTQIGVDAAGNPVFGHDHQPETPTTDIVDHVVSLEGAGLGINAGASYDPLGVKALDTTRYFGVEMQGIENIELRLADGRPAVTTGPISGQHPADDGADNFTVVNTPADMHLTIWGGGGNDVITVRGIGGPTKIAGGAGDDVVTVGSASTGSTTTATARSTRPRSSPPPESSAC